MDEGETHGPQSGVSQEPPGLLGRTIDRRYRVDSLLGEGGMGLVYRVTHTGLNKSLAIKVLRRENTGDPEVLARFRREAESASAIGHKHIVDINDFGTLPDGSTYFVMECLEGMDLIEAMDVARRMPEDRALHIAVQICRALGAAHDAGIVHRDLKPENVFLTKREDTTDFVKILDFGIAKVAHGPSRLTKQGEVLGTPHYMSPEQCEGEGVDERTDIYALGVLLYEMLTGHVPHDADTVMGILTKHMYEDPIPPKVRMPQVSAELEQVILKCLDKKPERRYQTMRELEADLARVDRGERPSGPDTVTLTPTRPPQPERDKVPLPYLVGIGLALVALVVTLALTALEGRNEPGAPVSAEAPAPSTAPLEEPKAREPAQNEAVEAELPSLAAAEQAPAEHPRRKRSKVKRRPAKPSPEAGRQDDRVILDPWK
jgi:serine/threonine-protein kinase